MGVFFRPHARPIAGSRVEPSGCSPGLALIQCVVNESDRALAHATIHADAECPYAGQHSFAYLVVSCSSVLFRMYIFCVYFFCSVHRWSGGGIAAAFFTGSLSRFNLSGNGPVESLILVTGVRVKCVNSNKRFRVSESVLVFMCVITTQLQAHYYNQAPPYHHQPSPGGSYTFAYPPQRMDVAQQQQVSSSFLVFCLAFTLPHRMYVDHLYACISVGTST